MLKLPEPFLQGLGISRVHVNGDPAVRIPYRSEQGEEIGARLRLSASTQAGAGTRRWTNGSRPGPYGLDRLDEARKAASVALVVGEGACHVLWYHGVPAIGFPEGGTWKAEWADGLKGIPQIYAITSSGRDRTALLEWLATSPVRDRVTLVRLESVPNVEALHRIASTRFKASWQRLVNTGTPWPAHEAARRGAGRKAAWQKARPLAKAPDILSLFADALKARGVAGERRAGKLLYLVVTSRLLSTPVSAVVKGVSAAGKSFLTKKVLEFFPDDAYYAFTAMSEHALAYFKEVMSHRVLVMHEAAGVQGDTAAYFIRSLLSEGQIEYVTAGGRGGTRMIKVPGPTGLLMTTSRLSVDPELETRLFSIPIADTPGQTSRVLRETARWATGDAVRAPVDLTVWHALQRWLSFGGREVAIPYAPALVKLIPPISTKLRRAVPAILALVKAYALLHRKNRDRSHKGVIVAKLQDYAAVRKLVRHLVADELKTDVRPELRETVRAVRKLRADGERVTVTMVADRLGLDKSSASRRIAAARAAGYVRNAQHRRGQPAELVLGEALPKGQKVLPSFAQVKAALRK